jgi:uncharacterized protein YbjT (DUF2867 family)
MTVLVIGGRSKIGSALINELLQRGQKVRALVRTLPDASAQTADGPDVEHVVGDLADRASLEVAMRDVESVFLLSTPDADDVSWTRNAVDAARSAGVVRFVRSSLLGADSGSESTFQRQHGLSDEYLAASGITFTILRPNFFSQNVAEQIAPTVDADGTFYASAGEAALALVDTRDVAEAAARVLLEDGHDGKTYTLTGPRAYTHADIASVLSTYLNRPIKYVAVPDDATREALTGFGLGAWLVEAIVELYASYRTSGADGVAARVTDDLARLLGREPRTLEQLLAERFGTV